MSNPTRSSQAPSKVSAQPHDTLFKWTFSQRQHAVGLLRAALPAALAAEVDFRTLRRETGSYVDRALRSRHSDLVFTAQLRGKPLYFYVLVEQQREVQPLMVVRMAIYMMRLWEEILRERPGLKEIPPILPLLIHHSNSGWTAATAFQEVVAIDDAVRATLLPYTPCFQMRLVDLRREQAENLVMELLTSMGQIVLWAFSVAGDDERLEQEISRITSALNEVLMARDANAALEVLLRYLSATHRGLSVERISEILEKVAGPQGREVIVTFLDEIEQRGREEGRAEMLLELLKARFGRVSAKVSAKVHAADEATLARWAVRVLSATTVEDVLDEGERKAAPARKPAARKRARVK